MMMEGSDRKRKRKKLIRTTRRKRTSNPLAWIWLLVAMMGAAITNIFVTIYEAFAARNRALSLPAVPSVDDEEEHPNVYERGGPCPPRKRTYDQWGYEHTPTLERLMRDLSLPGRLGRMAAEALLARIPNYETRIWAANRIEDGDYLELRRAKSTSSCDADILASWDRYARSDALNMDANNSAQGDADESFELRP